MGNRHVSPGDKVTYPVCPPASGKHINQPPLGPIPAQGLRAGRRGDPQRLGPQPRARRHGRALLVRQGRVRRRHAPTAAGPGRRASRPARSARSRPACWRRWSLASSRCRPSSRHSSGTACCTWTRSTKPEVYDFFTRYARTPRRARATGSRRPSSSATRPRRAPARARAPRHPMARARARPRPTRRARASRRRRLRPSRARPRAEAGAVRLYAYEDRFGDVRFGVLVDGKLLTGAQLEKRGKLDHNVLTHLGIGHNVAYEDGWRSAVEKATKRALKADAPLIAPESRRPLAPLGELPPGREDRLRRAQLRRPRHGGRPRRRRTGRCCSRSSPTRSSATARRSSGRRAPTPWTSRWSWASSSAGGPAA